MLTIDRKRYKCMCDKHYSGWQCETSIFCQSSPCANFGTCKHETHKCECPPGYHGVTCGLRLQKKNHNTTMIIIVTACVLFLAVVCPTTIFCFMYQQQKRERRCKKEDEKKRQMALKKQKKKEKKFMDMFSKEEEPEETTSLIKEYSDQFKKLTQGASYTSMANMSSLVVMASDLPKKKKRKDPKSKNETN